MAKASQVEEVLQWMHLAMGTEAEAAIMGNERTSVAVVIDKVQKLKKEADHSKAEAERYKSELQRFSSDHEAQIRIKNEKIEQLEDNINLSHKEIVQSSFIKNELESAKSSLHAKDVKRIRTNTSKQQIAELERSLNFLIKNNESLTKSVETLKEGKMENSNMMKGALHARFSGLSKMRSHENLKSKSIRLAGADWAIVVSVNRNKDGDKYLSIYLDVVSKITDSWMCAVRTKTHLLSQNGGVAETEVDKDLNIFCKERKDHGYERFISFKELLKSKNGYVKNDSIAVIIEMKCVVKSE